MPVGISQCGSTISKALGITDRIVRPTVSITNELNTGYKQPQESHRLSHQAS